QDGSLLRTNSRLPLLRGMLAKHTAVRADQLPLEVLDMFEELIAQASEIGARDQRTGSFGAVEQPGERDLWGCTRLGVPRIGDAHAQSRQARPELPDRELDVLAFFSLLDIPGHQQFN